MLYLYYFLTFAAGSFFGSFLNLVSDRVVNGEPILFGRSHCDHCKKDLKPRNLIPILSFIFQKGKCSFCGKKLSMYYPLSEVLTGLMFILSAYYTNVFQSSDPFAAIGFIFFVIVFSFYVTIVLTDMKYCLIPDKIVYAAIAFTALFIVGSRIYNLQSLYQRLSNDAFGVYLIKAGYWNLQAVNALKQLGVLFFSSFAISLFFLFLVVVTKGRGMGEGDIKLGFLIGLLNGFPLNVVAVFLGFIFGALYSVVLIFLRKKTVKDTIAFGPFLILGSMVSLFFGGELLNWYLNLF